LEANPEWFQKYSELPLSFSIMSSLRGGLRPKGNKAAIYEPRSV
jgi:hypothetical protein